MSTVGKDGIESVLSEIVDPHTGQTATCHDLRRTYGQRLALSGVSPYELKELMEIGINTDGYFNLIVGILASFVVGYLSIELLLRFLRRHGTFVFVIYRIVLGTGILLFLV